MAPPSADEITARVRQSLEGTDFAASDLKVLSGGTCNYIYLATLTNSLNDGTARVLVKHGENFLASNPNFKLTLLRCEIEVHCLKELSANSSPAPAPADSLRSGQFLVRTPELLHFSPTNCTQIQEYLSDGIDLKNYALGYHAAPGSHMSETRCFGLGAALGRWLKRFHETQRAELRQELETKAGDMQKLKHMINFDWLLERIDQFPAALGDARGVFERVKQMGIDELKDASKLTVIHGDFWTGNVLLPTTPAKAGEDVPVFVVDWEQAQLGVPSLDLGQMVAEMYELWLFRSIPAGLGMIRGLVEAYGRVSEDFAFRTAIQVGCHLVCFGTMVAGWGTPEQVEQVAIRGRDLIQHGWNKDRAWFNSGELSCLFSQVA